VRWDARPRQLSERRGEGSIDVFHDPQEFGRVLLVARRFRRQQRDPRSLGVDESEAELLRAIAIVQAEAASAPIFDKTDEVSSRGNVSDVRRARSFMPVAA
jgi:hypothetical protein